MVLIRLSDSVKVDQSGGHIGSNYSLFLQSVFFTNLLELEQVSWESATNPGLIHFWTDFSALGHIHIVCFEPKI